MTGSIEEFLGGFEPLRLPVTIHRRADLLAEHVRLQEEHRVALVEDRGHNGPNRAPAIFDRLCEVEDEIEASRLTVTFQALGSQAYKRLRRRSEHRPRKQDIDEGADYNQDSFPAALVAACASEPTITPAQAEDLQDRLSDGQWRRLVNTAIAVNVGADDAPKSVRRSDGPGLNGTSPTTAAPEGSPSRSSSDE